MAKEITTMRHTVKYKNQLNDLALREFKPTEMDLFFTIAAQVRDRGVEEVSLTFKQIRDQVGYSRSNGRLFDDLTSTYTKLLHLGAVTDGGHKLTMFNLFSMYSIDRDAQTVTIAVNERFKYLFNDLDQWTVFGLEEFINLPSTYSKTMYRLVKQFRTTGHRRLGAATFRALLDIPKSYTSYQIQSRVINVINHELTPVIPGFKLQPLRRAQLKDPTKPAPKRGKGAQIVAYDATWIPEVTLPKPPKDVTPKPGKSKKLRKPKKRKELLPDWAKPGNQAKPANHSVDSAGIERIEKLLDDLHQSNESTK